MTIEEIKRRNEESGGHWFEPGTMRFFASRVSSKVYRVFGDGRFAALFVSSEKFMSPRGDGPRRYTVRGLLQDGGIKTVSDFQQYASASRAHKAAKAWAANPATIPSRD